MKKYVILFFLATAQFVYAQKNNDTIVENFRFGIGLGMDFGGIGFKAEQMILDKLGAFIGAGYNFYGLGFNAGFVAKPFPNKMITPYIQAMGGYTGVIVIRRSYMPSRVDYGFSLGGGLELKTRKQNIFQLGIVLPFRSKGFMDYYEELLTSPSINFERELSPIALTMGYKIVIR